MSKESSIKVFAENASGTRPANAIPVWVDNISAIGGGASEEQINELSAAIDYVSANYIPYTASGLELPNSNFKIDTSGQAYKLGLESGTMPLEFGEVMAGFPDGALTELENGVTYTLTIQGAPDNTIIVFVNRNTQSPYADRPTITNNQCTFTWNYEDASVGIIDQYGNISSTNTTLTYTNSIEKRYVLEDELSSGFLQTSGLEYNANDQITGYNGSALAGGGDVPEDVMVESAIGYNAVGEISAYGNSAIAQYGAEKQWLVHDDTLVHASNSAQYALGCNVSALQRLMGIDETVLWEGSANTGTLNFTDPLTSFKEFKFYVDIPERGTNKVLTFYDAVNTVTPGFIQLTITTMTNGSVVNDWWQGVYNINATVDTATYKSMSIYANGQYYKQCSTTACGTNASKLVVKKVIGVGRKEV